MVRVLHVVTLSADGRELLLGASPDGRPTHSVALDVRLARAVRGEHPDGVPTVALLSPRDIQARLRAGASVEEVAAEAGVPVARVERFAGPVLSERAEAVAAAQRASVRRPRSGRSSLPLGSAVAAHLEASGTARPETASWSAARGAAGEWTVLLRVVVGGRQRVARWRYDAVLRELSALDAYAGHIGFVDPNGPPPVPAAPAEAAGRPAAPAAKRTPATKAPARKVAATKAPARKVAATKAPAAKVAATKAPAAKAAAKRAPAAKVAAKRAPAAKAAKTAKAAAKAAKAPAKAAAKKVAAARPAAAKAAPTSRRSRRSR